MTKTELAARNMLNSLRNPNARMPLIERLRDRESYYGTDAHLAAEYLDEACTLCDRAQDYMRIRLAHDPVALALADELHKFIDLIEHVIVPDDETPNVEVSSGVTK